NRMTLRREPRPAEPIPRDRPSGPRRRPFEHLERSLVVTRASAERGVLGEDLRLAAEAADLLYAADERRLDLGLDPFELAARRSFPHEARDLLLERALDLGEVLAAAHGRVGDVGARDLAVELERADVRRDRVPVDEALIEPRGLAGRQHVVGELQLSRLVALPLGGVPDLVDARLGDAVLQDDAARVERARDPALEAGERRTRRDGAEEVLDL